MALDSPMSPGPGGAPLFNWISHPGHIDVPKTELVLVWLILQVQRRRDSGVCGVCGVCASEPVCVCVRMCIAVPK